MTEKHLTDQKFKDLNLVDTLKSGLEDAQFEFCTPIQAQSLPIALEGQDVAGQAQTGTGKTVAFLLACCNYLLTHPAAEEKQAAQVRGLILAPTRELAIQIYKDAEVIASHTGLKLGLVYGGTGYEEQKTMLAEGVDILIGTPGRLIDFYKQNLYGLKFAQTVVLDEADRMFDLGFIKDIRYLLRKMPAPESRLNLLYSATLSFRVMELAYEHMNNPVEVKIEADRRVADKINETCFYPSDEEKPVILVNFLRRAESDRSLVFVNTRQAVEDVSRCLTANNISTAALSGDVPQKKRESLLEGFKKGDYKVLVATDVAARGLHIPEVSHVFNYDLPQDAEDYVHRIGRTARAGKSGEAIGFLCEKYAYSIMDIEEYIGHAIPKSDIEPWMLEEVIIPAPQPRARRGKRPEKDSKRRATDRKTSKPKSSKPKTDEGAVNVETGSSELNGPIVETPELTENMVSSAGFQAAETQPAETKQSSETIESPKLEGAPKTSANSGPEAIEVTATEALKPSAKPVRKKPLILPENRFSRKFGEIPLIG